MAEQISGYRTLSQEDIDLINEGKALEKQVADYYLKIAQINGNDNRASDYGRLMCMTGFMWLIRSIAKPENYWTLKRPEPTPPIPPEVTH